MKIAFDGRVLAHGHYTGVENYAWHLYTGLRKNVDTILLKPQTKSRILQQLWEHMLLPLGARGADILFCPANIAPFWKPQSVRLVTTLHDTAFITYPNTLSGAFLRYYKLIVPYVLRHSDRVITISEFSRDEIVRFYPFAREKIRVVHNGVELGKYKPAEVDKKERYILFVGSLNKRKNFLRMIEAFLQLDDMQTALKIVGRFNNIYALSEKEKELLDRAQREPRIHFLEEVDETNLVKLYQGALFLVFPSLYEGFGLPPLEAMACGTPVIVSHTASMPEVCADAALYVDPYSVKDMTEKMALLLRDEKMRIILRQKGLNRVAHFSWERSVLGHVQVFEEVLVR